MIVREKKLQLIQENITSIPNYPKQGILYRDITTLLNNPFAYQASIDLLVEYCQARKFTRIVGTEARGFLFAAPVAFCLGLGFVTVRKQGKLPREVLSITYNLEYGQDTLEIHKDSIQPEDKVLVIDDLLATGGTVEATVKLIKQLGANIVHAAFVVSLPYLGGVERLESEGINSFSLVKFPKK
ncbi:Adenine phosphoribosyltransferase [Candidatus Hartigia pinicola]|nr:Adenine phosphoribosyltransferase [Candidatus Hartigia pinicola]